MLKKKIAAVMLSAAVLAAAIPSVPAMADSQKVVTLGANLSEDQKTMILKYFGVYGEANIEMLTITNEDEREHLGSYIPLEQIGTRTFSCALVNPTTSGGIQVKTANLTYVTSNMIASTLSTSGVTNCEVLAAAPFEVSGTGALTGILMAYETASGETLDEEKKEAATQELVTTTSISDSVGQAEATQIVNETKIQVIEGNVVSADEIEVIVDEVAEEEDVTLSDEDRALLVELLEKIAELDYDYEEMSTTLERVQENVSAEISSDNSSESSSTSDSSNSTSVDINIEISNDSSSSSESNSESSSDSSSSTLSEDSILLNTDDSALGEDVVFDATDDAALEGTTTDTSDETEAASAQSETAAESETAAQTEETASSSDDSGLEITVSDSYSSDGSSDSSEDSSSDTSDTATEAEASQAEDSTDVTVDDTGDTEAAQAEADTEAAAEIDTEAASGTQIISVSELVLAPDTEEEDDTENASVPAGQNYLTISVGRTDLVAGSGSISLYNLADGSLIEEIQMSDTTKVVSESITDLEVLADYGWTEGTEFRIYLSSPLEPDMSYYVLIGDDVLTTADGSAAVQPSLDAEATSWQFDTDSYGIGLTEDVNGITAGSTVNGILYMDTSVSSYAVIDSIIVDGADVTGATVIDVNSGETDSFAFQITFAQSGETEIHVSYYDTVDVSTQQLVAEATYTVTVK
ncbi:MAG: DUF1002 domain-containing protein [Lachnospiraceae bacterium]|nr:DUF1002 domain-containing protein [Lachnospiraceae bacterium]